MKKSIFLIVSLLLITTTVWAGGKKDTSKTSDARAREVVIYSYDSFASDWGPADATLKAFTEKTGYKATMISVGDGAQVLTKAILEKDKPYADVLIGIDNQTMIKAEQSGAVATYVTSERANILDDVLAVGNTDMLTPFDYSHFAFMYDSYSKTPAPKSILDLTDPIYKNKIIIMDPRTSTPGLGFVTWTRAILGDGPEFDAYWKALKENLLTMAPSWDTGYGLFTEGEAPLCLSYTTSEAYHVAYDDVKDRFVALAFDEGHPMQIEYAAVVNGAPNAEGAKAFIDFLASAEGQIYIPETQWMYPINKATTMPESYATTKVPAKTVSCTEAELEEAVARMLAIMAD